MKLSAVILAGGKSSRMGQDKAFVERQGETLLARQIRLVREAGAEEVFISGRANIDYSSYGCRVLQDRLQAQGPLGGIERALAVASSLLLLVLAVDMPGMTGEFLRQLFSQCYNGVGAIPRVNEEIEPLAAVYPKAARGVVAQLFSSRERSGLGQQTPLHEQIKSPSARAFAKSCVEHGLAKFVDLTQSEAHFFGNWNSPQDMR